MNVLAESDLLEPTKALFSTAEYRAVPEASYGRKRIDLLLIPLHDIEWVAVELKLYNWRSALWQAAINAQLVDWSFVALWHTTVKTAINHLELFKHYGVGIISADPAGAKVVVNWGRLPDTPMKRKQKAYYLGAAATTRLKNASRHRALSVLPA